MASPKARDTGSAIDVSKLPAFYPTDEHAPEFWEMLGRTVATYGYLEDTLTLAIVSLRLTANHSEDDLEREYKKFLAECDIVISDQLGPLIDKYKAAMDAHHEAKMEGFEKLIVDMKNSKEVRNMICHAWWGLPNEKGKSRPFFVNRKKETYERTEISIAWLAQQQMHVAGLAMNVMNSITHMGWQFPGSGGPGMPIIGVTVTGAITP